jgi:hypothetical protein
MTSIKAFDLSGLPSGSWINSCEVFYTVVGDFRVLISTRVFASNNGFQSLVRALDGLHAVIVIKLFCWASIRSLKKSESPSSSI